MDTDSFIVYVETGDIYKDIVEDIEIRFDTSNYELDRPLPKAKNKKVLWLRKDELGGKVMTKFVGLNLCFTKRKLEFENYKNCLDATQFDNKIIYLFRKK